MSGLEWAGLPVSVRLVQPRYQVVVDEMGIGSVWEIATTLWQWQHYESRVTGSTRSRRAAVRAVLAQHSDVVAAFEDPS